jgi:hypothetical protein
LSDLTLEELLGTPQRFAAWLRSQDGTVSFRDTALSCPLAFWLDAEKGTKHIVKAHQVERVGRFDGVPLPLWGEAFIELFDDIAIWNHSTGREWVFASEITAHLDSHPPDWWQETQR